MYPGTRNLQSFSNPCTVHVFEKKCWQPKTATKSWKPLNLKGNVICAHSVQKPEIFFFRFVYIRVMYMDLIEKWEFHVPRVHESKKKNLWFLN